MKNGELESLGYDFEFGGGLFNSYIFQTNSEIIYEIKFKPTDYLFGEDSIFNPFTFELVIELKTTDKRPPLDKLIPKTIASIFEDFFTRNAYNIVVYLYESSDSRQDARRRKFDSWFDNFQKYKYDKIEITLSDSLRQLYYTTLIIRKDNPHRKQIISSFAEVLADYNK